MKILRKYQEVGVSWLLEAANRLLLDDMGLGKTAQCCAAIAKLGPAASVFITCPKNAKKQWAKALVEWKACDPQDIFIVQTGTDIIPVTAGLIIVNKELLYVKEIRMQIRKRVFDVGIVDECQILANSNAKITKMLLKPAGKAKSILDACHHRWFVSGTFMRNRPIEMFPILSTYFKQAIAPYLAKEAYGVRFCGGFLTERNEWNFTGASHKKDLANRLAPHMLRRLLDDVFDDMPPLVIEDYECDVPYTGMTSENTQYATMRKTFGLLKAPHVIQHVKEKMETCDRILVLAWHQEVVEGIAKGLKNAVTYYGKMTDKQKEIALKKFMSVGGKVPMVVNIASAGEALDGLQHFCNVIVLAEWEWSSELMKQAYARLRRLGQTKRVFVDRISGEGTLDDVIEISSAKKGKSIRQIIDSSDNSHYTKEKSIMSNVQGLLERLVSALELLAKAAAEGNDILTGSAKEAKPSKEAAEKPEAKSGGKSSTTTTSKSSSNTTKSVDAKTASNPKGKAKAKAVTIEQVREAAEELIDSFEESEDGQAELSDILKKFKAKNLKTLKPENYADALAAIQAAIEAGDEDAEEDEEDEEEDEDDDLEMDDED